MAGCKKANGKSRGTEKQVTTRHHEPDKRKKSSDKAGSARVGIPGTNAGPLWTSASGHDNGDGGQSGPSNTSPRRDNERARRLRKDVAKVTTRCIPGALGFYAGDGRDPRVGVQHL